MKISVRQVDKPLRVLDFDVEARPLGWLGGDWVHKEVTAISSAWVVDGEATDLMTHYIDHDPRSHKRMLRAFRARYAEADVITGHYIRNFDLPLVNGAMIEFGLAPLTKILSSDTKNDLVKHNGMSKSQENLGIMLGLDYPKESMDVHKWRAANRLTKAGIGEVIRRVEGDVRQHVEMREALITAGLLKTAQTWEP